MTFRRVFFTILRAHTHRGQSDTMATRATLRTKFQAALAKHEWAAVHDVSMPLKVLNSSTRPTHSTSSSTTTQVALVPPPYHLILGYQHPKWGSRMAPWFSVRLGAGTAADAAEATADEGEGTAEDTETHTLQMGAGFRVKHGDKDQVSLIVFAADGNDG